jgi:hypothetical protein
MCVFSGSVRGQLACDNAVQELRPSYSDEQATATYRITNQGSEPIRLISVTPDCACCTTIQTSKNDLAPGEAGKIEVLFKFEDRRGEQTRIITVKTDHPQHPILTLNLRVWIPAALRVEPAELVWTVGEALHPKKVTIKLQDDLVPVRPGETIKGIRFSTQVFSGELKEIRSGREWTVEVKPSTTVRSAFGFATIDSDFGSKRRAPMFEIAVK